MYLIKKDIDIKESRLNIDFEKVAKDLLLVSITNQNPKTGIPSYWRLTKVPGIGIPPLEIGIDCGKKYFSRITFFVDLANIPEKEATINIPAKKGNILVDTSIFTVVNDFVDINEGYEIYTQDNKLICMFKDIDELHDSYKNDRIEMYLDKNSQIIGFALCDLSEVEIEMIYSLK